MNSTGLEYTTMILHRQREHELMEEARKNTLVFPLWKFRARS